MHRKPFTIETVLIALVVFATAASCSSDKKPESNFIAFSKIDEAWKYTKGENTVVAVADWLFDLSPNASSKYILPTSMIPGQEVGSSQPWHGEWMAEIIHQIAPEAKIIPIRARPDNGSYEQYLREGIRFAADHGAVAITNSMGPVQHGQDLFDAVDYADKRGTVFINVHPEYLVNTKQEYKECEPAQCYEKIIHPGLISVPKYPTKPESSRDIYVWPYQITPKFKDGWGYSNGPPVVAGVVALMKSVNPKLTPQEVKNIIGETAMMKDGFKVLDAEAAVKETLKRGQ